MPPRASVWKRQHEELLGVPEVADDLLQGPVLLVGTTAEHALGPVGDGHVQLVAGTSAEALEPLRHAACWRLLPSSASFIVLLSSIDRTAPAGSGPGAATIRPRRNVPSPWRHREWIAGPVAQAILARRHQGRNHAASNERDVSHVVSSSAEMPHEIVMPRLGWATEEGTLIEWLKKDGDPVRTR
mgnify:CR=1 FL=1